MKELLTCGIVLGESVVGSKSMLDLQQRMEYSVKKIWVKDRSQKEWIQQYFPVADLVVDINSVLEDPAIGLILLVDPVQAEMPIIGQALKYGKHVRVI